MRSKIPNLQTLRSRFEEYIEESSRIGYGRRAMPSGMALEALILAKPRTRWEATRLRGVGGKLANWLDELGLLHDEDAVSYASTTRWLKTVPMDLLEIQRRHSQRSLALKLLEEEYRAARAEIHEKHKQELELKLGPLRLKIDALIASESGGSR